MGTKKTKEVLQSIVLRKTKEERKLTTGAIRSNAFRREAEIPKMAPTGDVFSVPGTHANK